MRIASVDGRLSIVRDSTAIDVETASHGQFRSDPQSVYERWIEFMSWAEGPQPFDADAVPFSVDQLGPPAPAPRQVFAVGLNYAAHADEAGFARPAAPIVFTKYMSSLSGPRTTVALPTQTVDWEVELVVVIGRRAERVATRDAWDYVAGLTIGQDLSERTSQHAGPAPQFGLAKSFPGFSPTGPVLVTPGEFDDPDDLELGCAIDGESVQHGRTRQMIFPVVDLVSYLSSILTLLPGDIVFTGTPAGVGAGRTPPRYLRPGQVLRSWIKGIGELEQTFVSERPAR